MIVQIQFNDVDVERLLTLAVMRGHRREYPRRAWTDKERKEAIRFLIYSLIEDVK